MYGVKIFSVFNRSTRIRKPLPKWQWPPTPVEDAGMYIDEQGGYYAGGNILVNGKEYAIIIAPKELSETTLDWNTDDSINTAYSYHDGKSNTNSLLDGDHPAAEYCANLDINGFDDWHLPSIGECEVCYRFLKPTTTINTTHYETDTYSNPPRPLYTDEDPSQTTVTEFIEGGSQAFDPSEQYWTSTERDNSGYDYAYTWIFGNGFNGMRYKWLTAKLRPVRWVEIT